MLRVHLMDPGYFTGGCEGQRVAGSGVSAYPAGNLHQGRARSARTECRDADGIPHPWVPQVRSSLATQTTKCIPPLILCPTSHSAVTRNRLDASLPGTASHHAPSVGARAQAKLGAPARKGGRGYVLGKYVKR